MSDQPVLIPCAFGTDPPTSAYSIEQIILSVQSLSSLRIFPSHLNTPIIPSLKKLASSNGGVVEGPPDELVRVPCFMAELLGVYSQILTP